MKMKAPFRFRRGLGTVLLTALPFLFLTGCAQHDLEVETAARIAEIQSLPYVNFVSREQLAQQIEAEVAVQINKDRLTRRIELEESRSDFLMRELKDEEMSSLGWFIRIVESSLAQENISQFDNTNLYIPFNLREAFRYQVDGLTLEMQEPDNWGSGIHREFLYVDIPFNVSVYTGEPLALNKYAKYIGVSGVFTRGRLDGNQEINMRWLSILYSNLERNIAQNIARFKAGNITVSELLESTQGVDLEQFENRELLTIWDDDDDKLIVPYEDIIGSIEHNLNVSQMNAIVGLDAGEPAIVPPISLIAQDELQLSGFVGYNLVKRGDILKEFGFDVSQLRGTATVRFAFEIPLGSIDFENPQSLKLVDFHFRSLTWHNMPNMREEVHPFPVFLEEMMSSLIDAGDRIVMNNDVTGGMAGRVYKDPRETLLHGVGFRGYHMYRRISEIAPLEYPYLVNRVTGERLRIFVETDHSTGKMVQHIECPENGRLELELNFGRLSLMGYKKLDNGEWQVYPELDEDGKPHPLAGERMPLVEGYVEYEYGQSSFLRRLDVPNEEGGRNTYFLTEVTRTIMERPRLVHAVQGTWVETWLYVFELKGSELYVVDRFRTSKIMHRDPYLYSGNDLERRLVYLSMSDVVTKETEKEVYRFFDDYVQTVNRMNIQGANATEANKLRDVLLSQDLYMLSSERAGRIRNWIVDNLTKEGTRTRVTGGITEILTGVENQVEILTLEMVEYADINVALVLENYILLQRFSDDNTWAIAEIRNMTSERIVGDEARKEVQERIKNLQKPEYIEVEASTAE